jgi:hypothetical protein
MNSIIEDKVIGTPVLWGSQPEKDGIFLGLRRTMFSSRRPFLQERDLICAE